MADFNTGLRFVVGLIGLLLSAYSLHVEISSAHDKDYKAYCDINERISCTKVFNSKHGRGFGLVEPMLGKESVLNLPNPVFGVLFYTLAMILCFCRYNVNVLRFLTFGSGGASVMSLYLASILYKMNDVCVVCISTYVVNFTLLFLNYRRLGEAATLKTKAD